MGIQIGNSRWVMGDMGIWVGRRSDSKECVFGEGVSGLFKSDTIKMWGV